MSEERLTGLVSLNIHRDIAVIVDDVIDMFVKAENDTRTSLFVI